MNSTKNPRSLFDTCHEGEEPDAEYRVFYVKKDSEEEWFSFTINPREIEIRREIREINRWLQGLKNL